jgi:hypothetical protein
VRIRSARRMPSNSADEHGELLAAVARGDVRVPHQLPQRFAEAAQQRVAGLVTVAVVEALEAVQVEHDQRQVAAVALHPAGLAEEQVGEAAVVVETGEAVVEGACFERRLAAGVAAQDAAQCESAAPEEGQGDQAVAQTGGGDSPVDLQPREVCDGGGGGDQDGAALVELGHGEQERQEEESPHGWGAEPDGEAQAGDEECEEDAAAPGC